MNCFFTTNHLTAFLDETLSEAQSREVRDHLTACDVCRRTHDDLLAVREDMRRHQMREMPLRIRAGCRLVLTRDKSKRSWRHYFFVVPGLGLNVLGVVILAVLLNMKGAEVEATDPIVDQEPMKAETTVAKVVAEPPPSTPAPTATPTPSPTAVPKPATPPAAKATPAAADSTSGEISLAQVAVKKNIYFSPSSTELAALKEKVTQICESLPCSSAEGLSALSFIDAPEGKSGVSILMKVEHYRSFISRIRRLGRVTGSLFEATSKAPEEMIRLDLFLIPEAPSEAPSSAESPDPSPTPS